MVRSTKFLNGSERSVASSAALSFVERMRWWTSRRRVSSAPKAMRKLTESRETSCGPSGFDEESALYALREEQLAEHTSWLAEQTS